MVNELKTLADAIKGAGFSGTDWENKFGEIKLASPCFVMELADDGTIADVRPLAREKAKVLRTWTGGSNGETFPAFNFQPFFSEVKAADRASKPSQKEKRAALEGVVAKLREAPALPEAGWPLEAVDRTKADRKEATCLGKIANGFFERICHDAGADDVLVRFREAFGRFIGAGDPAETFNTALVAFLHRRLVRDSGLGELESLLASGTDAVVFFDLAAAGAMRIASEQSMRIVNERLLATQGLRKDSRSKRGKAAATDEEDAFGNRVDPAELAEKLPSVKLPGALANTILRSMSGESKCQMRYGRIDAESFPVGSEIRKAAKSALAWVSSPEREGCTWAIAGANELVFAYPKALPAKAPRLARLLGNGRRVSSGEDDADDAEARFEAYAKEALQGLNTLKQGAAPNTEIEVFAIKKADKARRKVVFYRNYSLERLEGAVNEWNAGAANLPQIVFRHWPVLPKGEKAAKGTKPVFAEFHAPLPLSAVAIVYAKWSQDGNEKYAPKFREASICDELPVFDGLELFLGEAIRTGLAQRMLSLWLQNSLALAVEAGNLAHKGLAIENRRAALHLEKALPLLGIILHKLGLAKEAYMNTAPYLIGRFLNLADGLHSVWCRNEKEDDPLPRQLLGSSLFASFQLNPVQAFANAGLRMRPYLDWAKTNQKKDLALSRWYVGEFGRVAAAIKEAGIPSRLSDADKAEMLLGYLASTGKQPEADVSES